MWLLIIGQTRPFHGQPLRVPFQRPVASYVESLIAMLGTGYLVQNSSRSDSVSSIASTCLALGMSVASG